MTNQDTPIKMDDDGLWMTPQGAKIMSLVMIADSFLDAAEEAGESVDAEIRAKNIAVEYRVATERFDR